MKVYYSTEEYQAGNFPVATIGTFDGVHLGHRKILERVVEDARSHRGESVLITFHPHPRLVLFPEDNPLKLLHTLDEKIELLRKTGIDKLLIIPFTREFSRYTSDQFVRDILVKVVGMKRIIIGYDHHFGKNREGGLEDLRRGARVHEYEVEEIPAHQIDEANVSSTKIRTSLLSCDVKSAAAFLGYPYQLTGTVIHGQKMGRELGYPTANLRIQDHLKLIPGEGVYLVSVTWEGNSKYGGLVIGKRPTIGEFSLGIEVHIFDFDGDLYDKQLTVSFLHFIRHNQKFDSLDALKKAITADKKACLDLIPNL
jgi:riboflavin kinase/FMN adenylyltransferase